MDVKIFEQEAENTCALASFRTALSLINKEVSEAELVAMLSKNGITLRKWGICTPALGVLARKLGFGVTLYTSQDMLNTNCTDSDYEKSLEIMKQIGGKIELHEKSGMNLIKKLLKSSVLIVHVIGYDYYNLPKKEDWGHYLVLVADKSKQFGFDVLDCYRQRGYKSFKNWEKNLSNADNFNWNDWFDEIVEIFL